MLASVIIPARDAEQTLPRTLRALAGQRLGGEYEVIVVDDGSRDGTSEVVRAAPGRVQMIRQPRLGPAHARNRGSEIACGEVLAFCDADVYPEPDWLAHGVAALAHSDLVQGRVLPDPDAQLGPFDRTLWVTRPIGLYEAASLFVKPAMLAVVGGFVEWLRPRGGGKALAEDVWFGWRVRRAGGRTGFCEEALAYHAVFPRHWTQYAGERARLRFFPAMAAKMPELRDTLLYRRMFLNPRTARLDLALAGLAAAGMTRSRVPLIATTPYLRRAWRESRRGGVHDPSDRAAVAMADLAADLLGAAALASGSLRYRSVVI